MDIYHTQLAEEQDPGNPLKQTISKNQVNRAYGFADMCAKPHASLRLSLLYIFLRNYFCYTIVLFVSLIKKCYETYMQFGTLWPNFMKIY